MTRARSYPVVGQPLTTVAAEKPTPTKEQILLVLDSARTVLITKPQALLACAQLFGLPDDTTATVSWARRTMDYPAAERLFDRMASDGLIVGKLAHEWRDSGYTSGYLQVGTTYYVTARRALAIQERNEQHNDEALWEQAREAALQALAKSHPEQFAGMTQQIYDQLRTGRIDASLRI